MTLALISLFHKLLIKVVIYSVIYNSFYLKSPLFIYWPKICTFQNIEERSRFNASFTHIVTVSKTKSDLLKKQVFGISPEGILMYR